MTILVNYKKVEAFNFPGGESHVQISPCDIKEQTQVYAFLNNSDEIIRLLLTVDAIRRVDSTTKIHLTIPYFPYARQDRVCNQGESLSVKVMADMINALKCSSLKIYDPHSDVTSALLDNCQAIGMAEIIISSKLHSTIIDNNLTLISPDSGAEKKVRYFARQISGINSGRKVDLVCASKIRDTRTGKIIGTELHGDVKDKNVIILDDICDGGSTFIELSKKLKEDGANEIYLYVTHGIFSKGLDPLRQYFSKIYCYHTMLDKEKIDNSFLNIIGE